MVDLRILYLSNPYVSYARAARIYREALARAGAEIVDTVEAAEVVVIHDQPHEYPAFYANQPLLTTKYVVGHVVYDTEVMARTIVDGLRFLDEVWAPTDFTRQPLAAYHPQVYRVPYSVAPLETDEAALQRVKALIDYDESAFYFYNISNPADPRKGVPAALRAFERIYRDTDGRARFVLKQYGRPMPGYTPQPGVVLVTDFLSDREIAALHRLGNAYVSPHRGEGWGFCLSDAMACGRPVIATGYSGNRAFMDDENAYLVPFELKPMSLKEARYDQPHRSPEMPWAYVDEAALYDVMRHVMGEGQAEDRATRAMAICERFGEAVLTEIMADRLRDIAERLASPQPYVKRVRPGPTADQPLVAMEAPPFGCTSCMANTEDLLGSLVPALAGHAARFRIALAVAPNHKVVLDRALPADRRWLKAYAGETVRAWRDQGTVDLWHVPLLKDTGPFEQRRRVSGRYPITAAYDAALGPGASRSLAFNLLGTDVRPYDAILCSSEAARRFLADLIQETGTRRGEGYGGAVVFRGRLAVMPPAVDTERFRPRDQAAARARLQLPPDAFIIAWQGRFDLTKDADLVPLIEAFVALRRMHPNLVLVGAGSGEPSRLFLALESYTSSLEAGGAIRLRNDPTVHTLREYLYAAADVLVAPADNAHGEGYRATLEAMACGVPQVVADWGVHRELVLDGQSGFLMPTTWAPVQEDLADLEHDDDRYRVALAQSVAVDMDTCAERLRRLIADPALRRSMGRAARARAVAHYAWRTLSARYETMWENVLAQAQQDEPGGSRPPRAGADLLLRHFASHLLTDETALVMTERAASLLAGASELPSHHNAQWAYLDLGVLWRILKGFAHRAEAGRTLTLDDIIAVIARDGIRSAFVRRHVLWLLKYGLIRRSEQDS